MKKVRCFLMLREMSDNLTMKKKIEDIFDIDKTELEIVIDGNNPDYIISDTGIYEKEYNFELFKKLYDNRRIKILIVDEAEYPDMNLFDYAVMFYDSHLNCADRICAMPVSRLYRTLNNELVGADADVLQAERDKKEAFCNFLYSNGNAHPMRDKLFYAISIYKGVEAIGRHLNNAGNNSSDRTKKNWYRSSVEKKSRYKFSIAAENADFPGYTSEKLVSSLEAHTVPIYWGNPLVAEQFNDKAFINVDKFENMEQLLDEIERIDSNDDLWKEMVSQPWLNKEQEERERYRTEEYKKFTNRIFRQNLDDAHRLPVGTQIAVYTNHWMQPDKWGRSLFRVEKRKCAIFGGGTIGKDCKKALESLGIRADCFFDNDAKKWGTMCDGIQILEFTESERDKYFIIVATVDYEKAIFEQLNSAGAKAGIDYISYTFLADLIAMK